MAKLASLVGLGDNSNVTNGGGDMWTMAWV